MITVQHGIRGGYSWCPPLVIVRGGCCCQWLRIVAGFFWVTGVGGCRRALLLAVFVDVYPRWLYRWWSSLLRPVGGFCWWSSLLVTSVEACFIIGGYSCWLSPLGF